MKLDRNINADGKGKYALLKMRNLPTDPAEVYAVWSAFDLLEKLKILDWGTQGTESEFMLIRLKDKYAQAALRSYATEATRDDTEYANEIFEMANRAGPNSPWCKKPD